MILTIEPPTEAFWKVWAQFLVPDIFLTLQSLYMNSAISLSLFIVS